MEGVDKSIWGSGNKAVLGIYAKQPLPGQVKTRFCPPLSPQQAADLYQCALQEIVARMRGHQDFSLVICYTGERSWFERNFPGVPLLPQLGADLGARMSDSFFSFFRQGFQQVVLIGSDIPDLPLELVRQAFAALQHAEVALAPADDGGYVLIGKAVYRPELFAEIRWGSAEVLSQTLKRIESAGIRTQLLPGWEDLDDLEALRKLLRRSPHSRTADYLRCQLAGHFPERS